MPSLDKSLLNQDLGHLQIVAEAWGLEVDAPDARSARPLLVEGILDRELVEEVVEALPAEVRLALGTLVQNHGRVSWAQFTRRFGEVREMGPGRRDRERPERHPISPAEILWYRALVGRAFFDTAAGPQEFAYIPEDLMSLLPPLPGSPAGEALRSEVEGGVETPLGRPATPEERAAPIQATDHILDDACTLLAALRVGISPCVHFPLASESSLVYSADTLRAFLTTAELLDDEHLPKPEAVRAFLEARRGEALAVLAQAWLNSSTHNDLRLTPHLSAEGEWKNDPKRTRQTVLGFLSRIPGDAWWSLPALIAAVHQTWPDFQRPAGDYDSWFLRDERSGEFLRGFEHWDEVDGALIRYLICGPLHWLGVVDLAASEEGAEAPITAFRLSKWAAALLAGEAPARLAAESAPVHVRSDGRLGIPHLTPRALRYQIARFCEWVEEVGEEYRYRLTPSSLQRAGEQGLSVQQLLALLRKHAEAIPPNILKALTRWEQHGREARLERVSVLRVGSPELLQSLRASRAARFLGDPLGPTTVIVKEGAGEKVLEVLTEMGYLGEDLTVTLGDE
jgi:hypothetical protein